jgi:hypothetical protein
MGSLFRSDLKEDDLEYIISEEQTRENIERYNKGIRKEADLKKHEAELKMQKAEQEKHKAEQEKHEEKVKREKAEIFAKIMKLKFINKLDNETIAKKLEITYAFR